MSHFKSEILPAGIVVPYAGATAPEGWLFAFGQTVSRIIYKKLFDAIGVLHGAGDGTTTFSIPDLRGRVVAGKDNMGGTAATRLTTAGATVDGLTLGASGGNQLMHGHTHGVGTLVNTASSISGSTGGSTTTGTGNHTHSYHFNTPGGLTISAADARFMLLSFQSTANVTFPSGSDFGTHTHTIPSLTVTGSAVAQVISGSTAQTGTGTSQNVQPTIVLNQIIKT